jgi:transaldolase / glucose-6-phosphate isomerase
VSVATDLVERIWARDPTVWTGADEARWLGWLDESKRMRERRDDLARAAEIAAGYSDVVLLGMGGSSLAPEVVRRLFEVESSYVLDTTHPAAIRRLEESLDVRATLFISASKSGSTLETRSHTAYFLDKGGAFIAITDPGSDLERFAQEHGFLQVAPGEPTIGGRYSALSPFGMIPAAIMGLDVERLLDGADEMAERCRQGDDNPGLELGTRLAGAASVGLTSHPYTFGLWVEQLIAESTGKQGKGIVPAPDDPHAELHEDLWLDDPYAVGAEFFRWEFAVAVAGSLLGINPFDQPDVQAAKDKTNEVLAQGDVVLEQEGSLDELLAQARDGDYVAVQAFVDPARVDDVQPFVDRARSNGRVVTHGFGPRYLHSTGQLHKGGPNNVLCLQVVDDTGDELPIPGQKFGFARLIRAQAAGDYESLKARGRRVARERLEDV